MSEEDFIPACKFNKEGLLECIPKEITRDGVVTTKEPIKFHVDSAGKITVIDSGGATERMLEKTIRHLEKNLIIRK